MSAKENLMQMCMKGGKTEEECRKMMADAFPPAQTGDVDLMRKIDMLEAQVKTRETQLRQAIDIANRANNEREAKAQAEKIGLIDSIMIDGKFSKDELEKKTLPELQTMRLTLDKALERTFASVAAEIDQQKKKTTPLLTAGYFDSATKTWKGGI